MKTIQVVFPVLRGTRRFFVEKGRRWSVIEHLLLDAVCRQPSSAADLAAKSGLPRRVIVEALIRLMRAGWVEITATTSGPMIFKATPLGTVKAPSEQLPAATVTEPKWRGFAIEQVTGGVFRSRELDIRPQSRLPMTTDDQIVVDLQGSAVRTEGELAEVFTAIEGEDELIVGVDRNPEKLIERFAVVTVREDKIEGLPSRATPALRFLIQAKAAETAAAVAKARNGHAGDPIVTPAPQPIASDIVETPKSRDALYDQDDLIIDGPAHSTVLDRTIRNAGERLIIHSTFITEARAQALLPALLHAAGKGVTIDILWGQDDIGSATNTSQVAAAKLQAAIADASRADSITIHPFSTQSHAKIVIADNGKGSWLALVGSCNWLASDFSSFEASIRLRDPILVGELIHKLAGLARGRPGIWHDLAINMTVLGRRVEKMPRGTGRTVPMRLLFAPDHARLVLEARDRAKQRIFALSHRIGIAARPVALLPILAAVKANNIEARVYYGRTTGVFSGVDSAGLTREFAKDGMVIRPVHKPRLHAKALGWDDDALAISSLNWLSADPSDAALYREIGVFVEASRIADNFIRLFENARVD
jgi:cardiolipin synthase